MFLGEDRFEALHWIALNQPTKQDAEEKGRYTYLSDHIIWLLEANMVRLFEKKYWITQYGKEALRANGFTILCPWLTVHDNPEAIEDQFACCLCGKRVAHTENLGSVTVGITDNPIDYFAYQSQHIFPVGDCPGTPNVAQYLGDFPKQEDYNEGRRDQWLWAYKLAQTRAYSLWELKRKMDFK